MSARYFASAHVWVSRSILSSPAAFPSDAYADFAFAEADTILLGRESAGVPAEIAARADARLKIPMQPDMRSLNVAVAAGMVLGEALRQTKGFAS